MNERMKSKDAGAESNRIVMAEDEDAETLRHCAILGVCVCIKRGRFGTFDLLVFSLSQGLG